MHVTLVFERPLERGIVTVALLAAARPWFLICATYSTLALAGHDWTAAPLLSDPVKDAVTSAAALSTGIVVVIGTAVGGGVCADGMVRIGTTGLKAGCEAADRKSVV